MDIIEHFPFKNRIFNIDNHDEDEFKYEEEFFHLVSGSIYRIGIDLLEIYPGKFQNDGSISTNDLNKLTQDYQSLLARLIEKGIDLLDSNNPRIVGPIIDFFKEYLTANKDIKEL